LQSPGPSELFRQYAPLRAWAPPEIAMSAIDKDVTAIMKVLIVSSNP
jgi:hypothetical protein